MDPNIVSLLLNSACPASLLLFAGRKDYRKPVDSVRCRRREYQCQANRIPPRLGAASLRWLVYIRYQIISPGGSMACTSQTMLGTTRFSTETNSYCAGTTQSTPKWAYWGYSRSPIHAKVWWCMRLPKTSQVSEKIFIFI